MFINKKNKLNKGFTLIELLVVVSIIALLSSIISTNLITARAKGRNATRMSIAQTLRNAFHLGLTTTGFPSTGGTTGAPIYVCVSESCYGSWASFSTSPNVPATTTVNNFLASSLPSGQRPIDPPGGSRGLGGFLYANPSPGSNEATISYGQEGGSCGPGTGTPGASFTACILYLER
jgi:prepilin-type N-terminal cleavage/methylation domain-containing protein